jgi:hypothetical protein
MSSSSASTQANQTQNNTTKDNRIVGEAGSVNFADSNRNTIVSTDQSTTINNTLDAGAVGKSFDFAEAVSKGAASLSVASVGAMQDFGVDALSAVKDAYGKAGAQVADTAKMSISAITSANENTNAQVADAYKGVTGALADAWQTSKAGEQKMLAFGVVALVALGAVKVMGSR